MKKIVTTILLGTGLYAGGNYVTPVDATQSKTIEIIGEDGKVYRVRSQREGVYAGIGFGKSSVGKADGISTSLFFGYMISSYAAVELRYNTLLSDAEINGNKISSDIENVALYLKQLIPLKTYVTPYALVGYGKTSYGDLSDSGFQWGAGIDFQYTENLGFSVDYESFYSGDFDGELKEDIEAENIKLNTRYSF